MGNAALAFEGAGVVLDRYRPLKPLGTGGSGSVWLARDEQTGLDVALKIIPREGKSAARAEREAQAAAKLRHPSCLRAYAFARDPGHVYIAYEFVPGRTFREALRAGELRDADAIEACAQVCDGLSHAHAAGILHRDVKPSNVLLSPDGRAKILDFGLAQMAEAETLTAQGDVPGTLAYISPERLAGGESTPAADVWAVGVMLWESLAGRHPFWHTSMLDTARAIESGAPSLEALRPDLPKGLIQLVDRALTVDPARRPSAADLASGLRGAFADRRRKRKRGTTTLAVPRITRVTAPALNAAFAGFVAAELPFFPHGGAVVLALLAAVVTAVHPRVGLAFALGVPVLPLGNVSLGLAIAWAVVALAWLVLWWPDPEWGLLFSIGPLLAPVYALGLAPLATAPVRSSVRRAAQAGVAVLAAMLAAGLRHVPLPLVGGKAPLAIGLAGARDPADVAGSVARALGAHPALLVEAAAFAALALALPYARGRWGAAGLGAAMLVLTVACVPSVQAVPLVLAAWATAAATYKQTLRG
ncbi:MAG: serine/threonine-protein kinase [Actinomycetota bacterium]